MDASATSKDDSNLFQMRELIKAWDALRDAGTIITNSGCDFGHVLSLRAAIMSKIVEEARQLCSTDETAP
jgi:hypothetical protein